MSKELTENWLVRYQQRTASPRARLFCIPHAGGGASAYRLWPKGLPPQIEVCAIQLPGRETRLHEPLLNRIDAIVEALLPALMPHLDLPFAIFGHSMGAILAAQIVVALRARSQRMPAHLFVSARRAPHLPDPDPLLSTLPEGEFVSEIDRRYGGIAPEVLQEPQIMELFLPVVRADIAALDAYRAPGPLRIECPLSIFGGVDDSCVTRSQLEAWQEGATGGSELRMFPGNHFYVVQQLTQVLGHITKTLSPLLDDDARALE